MSKPSWSAMLKAAPTPSPAQTAAPTVVYAMSQSELEKKKAAEDAKAAAEAAEDAKFEITPEEAKAWEKWKADPWAAFVKGIHYAFTTWDAAQIAVMQEFVEDPEERLTVIEESVVEMFQQKKTKLNQLELADYLSDRLISDLATDAADGSPEQLARMFIHLYKDCMEKGNFRGLEQIIEYAKTRPGFEVAEGIDEDEDEDGDDSLYDDEDDEGEGKLDEEAEEDEDEDEDNEGDEGETERKKGDDSSKGNKSKQEEQNTTTPISSGPAAGGPTVGRPKVSDDTIIGEEANPESSSSSSSSTTRTGEGNDKNTTGAKDKQSQRPTVDEDGWVTLPKMKRR